MGDGISNGAHLVRFIVINMTNLISALAWASEDAIRESILQIKKGNELLTAVIERSENNMRNLQSR